MLRTAWQFVRKYFAWLDWKLGHEPREGEFDHLRNAEDEVFRSIRARHLAKRQPSEENINLGIMFLMALFGLPSSLIAWLFTFDVAWFWSAVTWAVVGVLLFIYLSRAAYYWREHLAIRREEVRRYGGASFG